MKRKFRFKALALALAVAIPSLVLAENLGEAEASGRPFWGKGEVKCTTGLCRDGMAYQSCTQSYYVFWISISTEPVSSGFVSC